MLLLVHVGLGKARGFHLVVIVSVQEHLVINHVVLVDDFMWGAGLEEPVWGIAFMAAAVSMRGRVRRDMHIGHQQAVHLWLVTGIADGHGT